MREMSDEDVEPIDAHRPGLRAREAFDALRELRPCSRLPLEQVFYFVDHRRVRA
jgi:hypothetical protein